MFQSLASAVSLQEQAVERLSFAFEPEKSGEVINFAPQRFGQAGHFVFNQFVVLTAVRNFVCERLASLTHRLSLSASLPF